MINQSANRVRVTLPRPWEQCPRLVISGAEDGSDKLLRELGLQFKLDWGAALQHLNLSFGLDFHYPEFWLDSVKLDSRPLWLRLIGVCQLPWPLRHSHTRPQFSMDHQKVLHRALQLRWKTRSTWLLDHCDEEAGREEQSSPTFDLQWHVSSIVHGSK